MSPFIQSALIFLHRLSDCRNGGRQHAPASISDSETLWEYQSCRELFHRAGWNEFLSLFQGNDDELTLKLSLEFDGRIARLVSLVFEVAEATISQAIRLPRSRVRWLKNHCVKKEAYTHFFKEEFKYVDISKKF